MLPSPTTVKAPPWRAPRRILRRTVDSSPCDPPLKIVSATRPSVACFQSSAMLLRSEEHTSELQSLAYLVCRLLLEKKKGLHSMLAATYPLILTPALNRPCP